MNPRQTSQYRRELRTLRKRERTAIRKQWAQDWSKLNQRLDSMSLAFNRLGKAMSDAIAPFFDHIDLYRKAMRPPCPFGAEFGTRECACHICPDGIIDECIAFAKAENHDG
jgi:hypothetical protein